VLFLSLFVYFLLQIILFLFFIKIWSFIFFWFPTIT
jgi:hypothetical protein